MNRLLTVIAILDGQEETLEFAKIKSRVSKLCYKLNMGFVNPVS